MTTPFEVDPVLVEVVRNDLVESVHHGRVVVTAPDGKSYAVAVMIGATRAGIPERQQFMQNVMRTLGRWKTGEDFRTRFGG